MLRILFPTSVKTLAACTSVLLATATHVLADQHEHSLGHTDKPGRISYHLSFAQTVMEQAPRPIASKWENPAAVRTAVRYPPYTDLWELEVPRLRGINALPRIRSARLENGDVMFGFVPPDKSAARRSIVGIPSSDLAWVTFFGRQAAVVDRDTATIKLEDGSVVEPTKELGGKSSYPGVAELKDGTFVVSSQDVSHDCYMGPAKSTLKRYQGNGSGSRGKLLSTKVIFLVLDEPTVWKGASYQLCDEADKELSIRVVAVQGNIIPLDDGGFLIVDQHVGGVFRFGADLSTQSSLLRKRLFVFDLEPSMGPLFIGNFTRKSYTDERGNIQMQRALDDLYEFLISLRKGEE